MFAKNNQSYHVPTDLTTPVAEAIRNYLQDGIIGPRGFGQQAQITGAVQPLIRFSLMNQLAKALGYQSDDLLLADQANFEGDAPDRLNHIIAQLGPWTKPIKTFKDSFQRAMITDDNSNIFQGPLQPDNLQQVSLAHNFHTLFTASNNMHKGRALSVHANFQLLSFMVKWHITVCFFNFLNKMDSY